MLPALLEPVTECGRSAQGLDALARLGPLLARTIDHLGAVAGLAPPQAPLRVADHVAGNVQLLAFASTVDQDADFLLTAGDGAGRLGRSTGENGFVASIFAGSVASGHALRGWVRRA